ncbi:hypothetical protein BDN67DRAFT_969170 [Paxillus ammoniavirescens]|nr:hypothetical protein BDN67DRAFT_969170 [Paxillus ammoniavirescens]
MTDSTAHRIDAAADSLFESSHIRVAAVGESHLLRNTAVLNTLKALYQSNHYPNEAAPDVSPPKPTFIPSATTLVAANASPPNEEHQAFMKQLTSGAQTAASSNFQSSIVAGPLSDESNEEFTDIGVWLGSGNFQAGQEKVVLASLGLQEWVQHDGVNITTREFKAPRSTEDTAAFLTAHRGLEGSHCFCVSPGGGPAIACFLIGELNEQWCGLVSIAVTSDVD